MGGAVSGACVFFAVLCVISSGYGWAVGGSQGYRAVVMGAALGVLSWVLLLAARRLDRWQRRW